MKSQKATTLLMTAAAILAAAVLAIPVPAGAEGEECTPCIDLVKTGPATANPGDVITYAYTVKNCGNVLLGSGAYVYDLMFQEDPIWTGNLDPDQTVTFYRDYTVPADLCGDLHNVALAVGIPDETIEACCEVPQATDSDSHTVVVLCDTPSPGTGTPGYWKNHPEAWPVGSIIIGGVTYSRDEAIAIMKKATAGDKTYTMFRALVSAKLNVLIGNNSSCIDPTITSADSWMAMYGPAGTNVRAWSYAWKLGGPQATMLDAYNNGMLCAPHRD